MILNIFAANYTSVINESIYNRISDYYIYNKDVSSAYMSTCVASVHLLFHSMPFCWLFYVIDQRHSSAYDDINTKSGVRFLYTKELCLNGSLAL